MAHKTPFQIQKERNLLVPKHLTHVKMHKTTTYEPQMAVIPIQQKPNDSLTSQGVGRLKLHHTDSDDGEHLKANVKTMKNVSGDRMMRNTPSMIQMLGSSSLSKASESSTSTSIACINIVGQVSSALLYITCILSSLCWA